MITVACLGLALVDAVGWPLAEYPSNEKPQVNTEHLRLQPGGGATNAAVALTRLGFAARLFAKVGDDFNRHFLLGQLTAIGVDTTGVCVDSSGSTPFTYVGVRPDGERTFIHTPGANRTFSVDDIDQEALWSCDALVMPDTFALPMIDGQPGASLLAEAGKRGIRSVLDETHGVGPAIAPLEEMAREADVVAPSFQDLSILYPDLAPRAMVEHLVQLGARAVVLKLGAEGSLVGENGRIDAIPARATRVVNATGAGDAFNAGLIAALAGGESLRIAAEVGAVVASAAVAAVGGATAGIPPYKEVRAAVTGVQEPRRVATT